MKRQQSKITIGTIGILIGAFFLWLNGDMVFGIVAFILGGLTIVSCVRELAYKVSCNDKDRLLVCLCNIIGIILGVLLMINAKSVMFYIIGAYLVIYPIIDIIISKYKTEQLKIELPRILLGIILMIIGPGTLIGLMCKIIGIALIVISTIYIAVAILKDRNK